MPSFSIDPKRDTICAAINHWAEVQPEAPALQSADKKPLTYRALSQKMGGIRTALNAEGLGRGDRIGVIHSGGADLLCTILGVMSGSTAVPFNHNFRKDEFNNHFNRSGITALAIEDDIDSPAHDEAARAGIPCLKIVNSDPSTTAKISISNNQNTTRKSGEPSAFGDLALVSSTSGTTSKFKVLALEWQKVLDHCHSNAEQFLLTPNDTFLQFRPLYYTGPLFSCLSALYSGGNIVIRPRFDADRTLRDLPTHQITWLHCGPTYLKALYETANTSSTIPLKTSLRFIRTGTGRTSPRVLDELEELLGAPILETYSSSEAGPISSNLPPPKRNKRGTVGVPPKEDVAILGSDRSFQTPGNRGEIIVRGKRVIRAYEHDPEANAEAFVDGWFRTGDEGFIDEDGYLRITGRIKEMIHRGGEKISPTEVDAALMEHPSVQEGAAFPFRHPTLGEEVAAIVVLKDGVQTTESDLIDFLFERLSNFKVPKKVIFSEMIPKSEDGKLNRRELAEIFDVRVKS